MAWSVSGAWIVLAAEPIVGGACGAAVLALLWLRRRRQRAGSVPGRDEVAGLPRSVGAMRAAAQAGAVADAGVVDTKSSALSQPRCVRPSWKAELRQAGTNALEEAERKLVLWDLSPLRIPLCFHASKFLTSHALIGRSHALRGSISHVEETMR